MRQLQAVVLALQQAVVGLHTVVHNVQGMQLPQGLHHNSVLVSNMCLTNRLSWHAWCKQHISSARKVMHWQLSQVNNAFLK